MIKDLLRKQCTYWLLSFILDKLAQFIVVSNRVSEELLIHLIIVSVLEDMSVVELE